MKDTLTVVIHKFAIIIKDFKMYINQNIYRRITVS